MPADKLILVTGATGYVGGRLLPLVVEDGWRVRCLARQPERLPSRVPAGVEVVPGDVLDAASLPPAMQGVEAAYYLVHSMGARRDFEEQDRLAADNFAAAYAAGGFRRTRFRRHKRMHRMDSASGRRSCAKAHSASAPTGLSRFLLSDAGFQPAGVLRRE